MEAQHEKQAVLGPFGQVLQGETAWCLSCQSGDMVTVFLPMALWSEWSLGAGLDLRQYTNSSPQGTCLKFVGCSFAAG